MIIGKTKNGKKFIEMAEIAPNQSISITGISGSGKTTTQEFLERAFQKEGRTVIVLDLNGTHMNWHSADVNRISVKDDGIDIAFLDTALIKRNIETEVGFISDLAECLAKITNCGIRQLGILRTAVEFAVRHREDYSSDMDAIADGLLSQENERAKGVYEKLWGILTGGFFRKSNKKINVGEINIITFEGISRNIQKNIAEIFLHMLWKRKRLEKSLEYPIVIALDEYQNFSLKDDATLLEMLREGRKYGISLILTTQTTLGFSKKVLAALNQSALRICFHPLRGETKKIAEEIEPGNSEYWSGELARLSIGEFVISGNVKVDGRLFKKPLIGYTEYLKQEHVVKEHPKLKVF